VFGIEILKLAHFSVKEYLVSPRIQLGPSAQYGLSKRLSDTFMSHTCLVYLLQFDTIDFFSQRLKSSFPLAWYAATYWVTHARSDDGAIPDALESSIAKLLEPKGAMYINWVLLYHENFIPNSRKRPSISSPLVYAAGFGLEKVSQWLLLEKGQQVNNSYPSMNALHSASLGGHETIVRLLLQNGADVNSMNRLTGTALTCASRGGHEAVVRLLLENGAEINAFGDVQGTALNAASGAGHEAVVRLLLENGAKIEKRDIEIARYRRHEVIAVLLENGAKFDAE
jgi:hypothetical protein